MIYEDILVLIMEIIFISMYIKFYLIRIWSVFWLLVWGGLFRSRKKMGMDVRGLYWWVRGWIRIVKKLLYGLLAYIVNIYMLDHSQSSP
jgi:hypothetical protein